MPLESLISKVIKRIGYMVLACGLVGACIVGFTGRAAIAERLNAWQLLPHPERYSELYFADYHALPSSLPTGAKQNLAFVVANFEHQTTVYQYQIVALAPDTLQSQQLGSGSVTLAHGTAQTILQTITVPALGPRVNIKVMLQFSGIPFGHDTPSPESQAISYWITVSNFKSKENHASKP